MEDKKYIKEVEEKISSFKKDSLGNRKNKNIPPAQSTNPSLIFLLQQTVGNKAVEKLIESGKIQPFLKNADIHNSFEKEANLNAEKFIKNEPIYPSKNISRSEKKPQKNLPSPETNVTEQKIADLPNGSPLPYGEKKKYESFFNENFDDVKIHTDEKAAEITEAIDAKAVTYKNKILFNEGQYSPSTEEGKKLITHELTHVWQHRWDGILKPQKQEKNFDPSNFHGMGINKIGIVFKEVNLFNNNRLDRKQVATLPINTRLNVIKEYTGHWYFVATENGKLGYLDANCIKTNLPEPNAVLHKVESGESAIEIAEKYFKGNNYEWGQDLRYYVNVLVHINDGIENTKKGIYKENKNDNWDKTKIKSGYYIWIPSLEYAKTLTNQVKSGSLSYELIGRTTKAIGQKLEDYALAIKYAGKYIPEALKRYGLAAIQEALIAFAIALVASVGILAVTTSIGAVIGFCLGGVTAGAGAGIGFNVGLYILKWLGLGLLITWAGSKLLSVGKSFWTFLHTVWNANGDKEKIEEGAIYFAEAIGEFIGFILEAVLLVAMSWGTAKALNKIENTKFGKWIGKSKLGKWLNKNSNVKRYIPKKEVLEPNRRHFFNRILQGKTHPHSDKNTVIHPRITEKVKMDIVEINKGVLFL